MRFVAMDFETASHRPDSACQIGLVVVDDGKIIAEHVQLIRPASMYFSPGCVAIHGIHPHQVQDAPTWDSVWEQFQGLLEEFPIIAHNASFDLNVLCGCMKAYGLTIPYLEYNCTRLLARRAWPGMISYALKSLASSMEIEFKHHDALEDSRVCAAIVLATATTAKASTLEELERNLGVERGRVQFGARFSPKGKKASRSKLGQSAETNDSSPSVSVASAARSSGSATLSMARAIAAHCGHSQPLAGRHVVLSGRLLGMDRAAANGFLQQLGGVVQSDINLQTDFVICGTNEEPTNESHTEVTSAAAILTDRQKSEIEIRRESGQNIRMLSQRQLLALIPGAAAIARTGIGG